MKRDLQRAYIFLSASFPSGERGDGFRPYDASAVADAVAAFARSILLNNGQLLFGGHPTITPLVLMVARKLDIPESIVVFQSEWFEKDMIPEVLSLEGEGLGKVEWVPKAQQRAASLLRMRKKMIRSYECRAALFIGGMEGIFDEYDLVKELSPETLLIPISGPGGAAAKLDSSAWELLGLQKYHDSRVYPHLAIRLVDALLHAAPLIEENQHI